MTHRPGWTGRLRKILVLAPALGIALPGVPNAGAQDASLALHTAARDASEREGALSRGRYAVVIDLDRNTLYFKRGDVTLWSAPVGTGTGLRLKSQGREWKFSTPNGVFQVKYKEQAPDWIAPDWYFVENGLPVPPPGDRSRYFPGGLGAAAVYLEKDLAIHGTNKPELLGQRVSHGCIRLANKDAIRLYHNVQIGTEVVIVGGEDLPEEVVTPEQLMKEKAKATFDPAAARGAPVDPTLAEWKKMSTPELRTVLENELWLNDESSRWPEVANLLLHRGLAENDDAALAGLMEQITSLRSSRLEREYATFLADAFGRGALRTLTVLSRLPEEQRLPVANAIVEATLNLYAGSFDEPAAPWPTARVPRSVVEPAGWRGWDVLAEAERDLRSSAGKRSPTAMSVAL